MSTFYNFALKRETSWAKKVLKPNLETLNANANCLCLVYLFSDQVKIEICNVKKNDSKCPKFTIKN